VSLTGFRGDYRVSAGDAQSEFTLDGKSGEVNLTVN
jgi:hypothetical protein